MTASATFPPVRVPAQFDVQGHRGARGVRPENTWPAFACALALGVPTLELDIVVSTDGEVVVSHEPWMDPAICTAPDGSSLPEDNPPSIYQMTYAEVAAYDCGCKTPPHFPEQASMQAIKPRLYDVLTRSEALAATIGRAPVFYNIETKSRPEWEGTYQPDPDVFAQRFLDVVHAAGVSDRVTLQSFDVRTLQYTRTAAPSIRQSILVAGDHEGGVEAACQALGYTPHIYSPDYRLVDSTVVQAAHVRNMQVLPWTVNAPAAMKQLITYGVDGFITDYPARGLAVAAAYGHEERAARHARLYQNETIWLPSG